MNSHAAPGIADPERAPALHDAVLSELGCRLLSEGDDVLGCGNPGGGEKLNLFAHGETGLVGLGTHVAFVGPSPATADSIQVAALAWGGRDDGPPDFVPISARTIMPAL